MEEQTTEVSIPTNVGALIEETSAEFLGRWNRLISTTNWEKGRIIGQWRGRLAAAGAPATSYSDEAWSRQVDNVTPQHVGRLRRVFQRFADAADQYQGLYWSHFQAALDWDDAEMWLEGAVQNDWSVSQMRQQRWQVQGAVESDRPHDADIVTAEVDEDVDEDADASADLPLSNPIASSTAEVHDPEGDETDDAGPSGSDREPGASSESEAAVSAEKIRPFENMPDLPPDLHEAFERFKLAILSHKVAGWREISRQQVLDVLERLKQLALTPGDAPF